ncbi:MAG: cytidylate kinase-like family protein [Oscillospiraceae bacterium]|nr:cytidylate kinase-like family protein [Oscillospiraceae bacterium]
MSNLVITISRMFGSGGRLVGENLSKALGIPIYDRAVIEMAAEESGLSKEYMEKIEASASSKFLFNLRAAVYTPNAFSAKYDIPPESKAYIAQAKVIQEIAAKESCIIVGRCADDVLAGRENINLVRLFIYGDEHERIQYAVKHYGVSEADAKSTVTRIDKGRANYYNYYTNNRWGELKNYDLCINTSVFPVDSFTPSLAELIKNTQK